MKSLWAILFNALFFVSYVDAQSTYSGVWSPSTDKSQIISSPDWTTFTTRWAEVENNGFRMHDYEVYFEGGRPVYLGLFRTGNDARAAWVTTDWADFIAKWDQWEKNGLLMHDYESYEVDGVRWYAGIFRASESKQRRYISTDWKNFTTTWDTYVNQDGYRMHDFETYVISGTRQYVGVFRTGTGLESSWFTTSWDDLMAKWTEARGNGLMLWDFEFFDDGNTRTFGAIFRPGASPSSWAGWFGVDWENFRSFNNDRINEGFALDDIEIFPGSCGSACMNQVLMPKPDDVYNYQITSTATHCEGLPGTCTVPGAPVVYRSPSYFQDGSRYVKLSTTDSVKQLFTLPFSDANMQHNGWLYGPGQWHHAIDYLNGGTFSVEAAAPGEVIHVGWDLWSGNTVVISHNDGADVDRYRTIYMHLRDGAARDCENTWSQTVPSLDANTTPEGISNATNFKNYLRVTACESGGASTPSSAYWGDITDRIGVTPGTTVTRGQFIAKSGSTGPGGCGCTGGGTGTNTHLHIFFARRDETDNLWYFFDPYGIYGPPECYPTRSNAGGGASGTSCARYPSGWEGGVPRFP